MPIWNLNCDSEKSLKVIERLVLKRLMLKIDQVTMSEVVEVSVRQWVYIVKKKAEKA